MLTQRKLATLLGMARGLSVTKSLELIKEVTEGGVKLDPQAVTAEMEYILNPTECKGQADHSWVLLTQEQHGTSYYTKDAPLSQCTHCGIRSAR